MLGIAPESPASGARFVRRLSIGSSVSILSLLTSEGNERPFISHEYLRSTIGGNKVGMIFVEHSDCQVNISGESIKSLSLLCLEVARLL